MDEVDDSMELDENVETAQIIERKSEGLAPKPAEVVVLDDEDKKKERTFIDLVQKPKANRCLNTSCPGVCDEFVSAPDFCLSFFRVKRSKNNTVDICSDCYVIAVKGYDKLVTEFHTGNPVLSVDIPMVTETLQIDDSDEEQEGQEDEDEYLEAATVAFLKENLDSVLNKMLKSANIEREVDFLLKENGKLQPELDELTKSLKTSRAFLDGIQFDLYKQFRPDYKETQGISIIDDWNLSVTTVVRNEPVNSKIVELPIESSIPFDLPPLGSIEKPPLLVGNIYYINRDNSSGSWIRARLQNVIQPGEESKGLVFNELTYRLIELKQQRERFVQGKSIAYVSPSPVRLQIGVRVLAVFKEIVIAHPVRNVSRNPFYPGIVAEPPFEGNNYRYLIFFDIGYSQYVSYKDVNLIYESSENVWEDMHIQCRPFIKKYLECVDRRMVKLHPNQNLKVEYNGKWWTCQVREIDCSLAQVFFKALERTEWIYRGSSRLGPIFREEQTAKDRGNGVRSQRKPINEASVMYSRPMDIDNLDKENKVPVRAVARKSTTKPQNTAVVPFLPRNPPTPASAGPTTKIVYFIPRDKEITKRSYIPHTCSVMCTKYLSYSISKLRGHNPISKPLLCGWARMTTKAKTKKEIMYKAPCGRLLRNIGEVHYYLKLTGSDMTVDLFDFHPSVRCLAEFSVDCSPDPKDLSKGLEQVPIPVINGVNNDTLIFSNYSTRRLPMEGVNLNLDPEFLCGCDCEDDCVDKSKCACWKMTLEGAKYLGKDVDPDTIGYVYRRLPEQLITGIYECNIRCKCSATCLNRVVQNPMSVKLQVFKTHNCGWGIRCLNDIPQGTFICIYAGTLHTEQTANEDGKAFGDEYFAELDYIESVEQFKEGYEEEAMEEECLKKPSAEEDDEEELKFSKRKDLEDNDFVPNVGMQVNTTLSGLKTRLRKRNHDEDKVKEEVKVKEEIKVKEEKMEGLAEGMDTVTISDDEDEDREVLNFNASGTTSLDNEKKYISVRALLGEADNVYIMDAKNAGNIGRFLNHSCSPNVFVQNVFVDTHDPRFPWVAFFSSQFIRAGTELTWNYNYDIGSVPGRVLYCHCGSLDCKGRLL